MVLACIATLVLPTPPLARADRLIQQGSKLTASGQPSNGEFGDIVALSGDGNTALVGSTEGTSVLTRSGSTWTQQTSLPVGAGLALSGDGNTALIASSAGTFVFTRSGSTWTQQTTLVAGASVALSPDGNTALIGAPTTNEDAGAAWVYARSGSTWSQQAELTSAEASGPSEFGYSVALSGDGNTALVGAPGVNPGCSGRNLGEPCSPAYYGAAWVFVRSGGQWTQQGTAIPGLERGEPPLKGEFGTAVALSGDGNTALIGGDNRYGAIPPWTPETGAAWVYTRSGSTWNQPGTELTAESARVEINQGVCTFGCEGFGFPLSHDNVALSADGNSALIGGDLDTGLGAAWSFTRSGSTWDQDATELQGSDEIGSFEGLFGAGLALSATGNTALIGDPRDDGRVGAAWIFASSPTVSALSPRAGPVAGGTTVSITGANFTGVSAVKFGSLNAAQFTVNSENSITAESPPGSGSVDVSVTTAQGTSPAGPADRFDYGLAITNVSPDSGSTAGGRSVTITGSGFSGATAVRFGSRSATHFTVNSESSITAISPPGAGSVDVSVTTPHRTTPASAADRFSYANVMSFSTGAGSGVLGQIITGPDGNLWFTESSTGIGRITPQGAVREFPDIRGGGGITPGSEGDVWFVLGRITSEGVVNKVHFLHVENLEAIALGPDGNVWISHYSGGQERDSITGITPEEERVNCCALPETHTNGAVPLLAGGTNNDLWFSWDHTGMVRATLAGVERQYPVGSGVQGITVGPGDDLWFTDPGANEIGRITPEGLITRFSEGIKGNPSAIAAGQEGDIWFTEPGTNQIGRITPEGVVTQFSEGISSAPVGITAGREGAIWFTEESGQIGRLTLPSALNPGATSCNGAYGGSGEEVIVPAGAVCTLAAGTHVSGNVQVKQSGTLIDEGGAIGHDLSAEDPKAIAVAATSVGHDVQINGPTGAPPGGDNYLCDLSVAHDLVVENGAASAGRVDIGGPPDCSAGNQVGHDLVVQRNAEPVEVSDNGTSASPIGHDLEVQDNEPGGATVSGNYAGHDATCQQNSPQTGSGNHAAHNNSCPT
jgi:streptogramin lyase